MSGRADASGVLASWSKVAPKSDIVFKDTKRSPDGLAHTGRGGRGKGEVVARPLATPVSPAAVCDDDDDQNDDNADVSVLGAHSLLWFALVFRAGALVTVVCRDRNIIHAEELRR
jgi:hypothetical protein